MAALFVPYSFCDLSRVPYCLLLLNESTEKCRKVPIHSFSSCLLKIKQQNCNFLTIFHHSWQSQHRVMVGEMTKYLLGWYRMKNGRFGDGRRCWSRAIHGITDSFQECSPSRDLFLSFRGSHLSVPMMKTADLDFPKNGLIHPVEWRPGS